MARNYGPGPKWRPAVVNSCLGPATLLVETGHSQLTWKRHHDQLRSTQLVPDLPLTAVRMFWRLINHHTLLSLHLPQHHLPYPAIHKGPVNHLCVMAPHLVFDYIPCICLLSHVYLSLQFRLVSYHLSVV